MFRHKRLANVLIFLFVLLADPADAALDGLHWNRGSSPVVVTVHDMTGNDAWGVALRKLADEWSAGTEGVEFVFSAEPANCLEGHGPYTLVVCIRENSQPNHIAEARLYRHADGEHISHATIWMDPRPSPAMNHLACHELGHVLGLEHREPNAPSCMTDGYREWVEHPDRQDFNTVNSIYSHVHA